VPDWLKFIVADTLLKQVCGISFICFQKKEVDLYYDFEPDIFDRLFSMTGAESIKRLKALSKNRGVPLTLNVSRDVPAHGD